MKLVIREYLAGLKEREELDAILPDLLSELGCLVISRPQRGTTQHGVDVAAVGADDDGERKLFLFSIKPGDLTRSDWSTGPQALYPSLLQILDVYIPTRIPKAYANLKIVIVLCVGGVIQEPVQPDVRGFINRYTTLRISFAEWSGDVLAEHLLKGILREEILPKPMRANFQKAVAMVDEPDVSFRHFKRLAKAVRGTGGQKLKKRVQAARQLYVCTWILYVWARDAGNIEAAYRASEALLLDVWEISRPTLGSRGRDAEALTRVLNKALELHLTIASEFLDKKIFPYVGIRHGLSHLPQSQSAVDVNLSLFNLLGRIGATGLWLYWCALRAADAERDQLMQVVTAYTIRGLELIESNPALELPISDDQAVDVVLFLMLWAASGVPGDRTARWLGQMVARLNFTIRGRGRYTTCFDDYRALAEHPRNWTDDYFKEATAGSTLVPILMAWTSVMIGAAPAESLRALAREKLEHCTFQLWMPDAESEAHLYLGDETHGRALTDIPVEDGATAVLDVIANACRADTAFNALSVTRTDWWPLILLACRHHRLPVPPQCWITSLTAPPASATAAQPGDEPEGDPPVNVGVDDTAD